MKYKQVILLLCFVGIMATLLSFQNGINKASHDALQKKMDNHRKLRIRDCNEKAMEDALVIVDSLLLRRVQVLKTSPIDKPPIPPKPTAPEVKLPDDQTPVAPFIKN